VQCLLLQAGRYRAGTGEAYQAKPRHPKHRQQVTGAAASSAAEESRYRTLLQYAPVLRDTEGKGGIRP